MIIVGLLVSILLLLPAPSFASKRDVQNELNIADHLMNTRKQNQALPYLNDVIAFEPDNTQARMLRACLLIQLDEGAKALKDLDVVFKHGKGDQAYQYRSEVMYMVGKPDKAMEDITIAINMATNDEARLYRLQRRAELWRFLKRPDKSLEDITTAMTLKNVAHPESSGSVLIQKRANTYMQLGRYKDAVADYTVSIASKKSNDLALGRIFAQRAAAYEKLGQHDLAEADMKKSKLATTNDFGDMLK